VRQILVENFKKLPILWQNPMVIPYIVKEIFLDLHNDLRSFSWPENIIHIAGLPKSGSTWLFSLLCHIPGYNPCPGVLRPLMLSQAEKWTHELSQEMFDAIPKSKYTVLKLHTNPTENNLELLERNKIKTIILIRDLRNMAVSRYIHEKTDRNSWCYKWYNEKSLEEGMWHNLEVVSSYYVPWVEGWLEYHRENRRFLDTRQTYLLRYEELKRVTSVYLGAVLDFLGIRDSLNPKDLVEKEERKTKRKGNLRKNLNRRTGSRDRSTYSGRVYDWRDYFSKEQEEWFRERAEDILKRCKYEW